MRGTVSKEQLQFDPEIEMYQTYVGWPEDSPRPSVGAADDEATEDDAGVGDADYDMDDGEDDHWSCLCVFIDASDLCF